jgi:hypothetical protein
MREEIRRREVRQAESLDIDSGSHNVSFVNSYNKGQTTYSARGKYGRREMVGRVCEYCGRAFAAPVYNVRRGRGRFCSPACVIAARPPQPKGERSSSYRPEIHNDGGEYLRKRVAARNAVQDAVDSGRLTRPDRCEQCGRACKPRGHHPDYTQPLYVRWLCARCHAVVHGFCGKRGRKVA